MARSFKALAAEVEQTWSPETHEVYSAASASFEFQMAEKARLGGMLRSQRESLGLTQPALAALADIQQAEISRIERGLSNPTETTLIQLLSALRLRLTVEEAPAT